MDKPADKAREQMRSMGLSAPYIGSEETRTEEEIKADRKTLAENVPILGEAILAKEIADDVKDENYLSAGLNTAALAVGAIPGVGDILNKPIRAAAKKLRKADKDAATKMLSDVDSIETWKKQNPNPKPQKQNPDVEKSANDLLEGKITGKQHRSVVKENMPIVKIDEVPEMPSFTEIVGALDKDKSAKGILGLNKSVKDGTRVSSRLDIPAYERFDKWVVSVHDAFDKKGRESLNGDIVGYGKTAILKNVDFKGLPQGAANIAAKRNPKGTIARIFGDYYNAEPENVAEYAKQIIKNKNWTQVGYNPFRHGFFYDKNTGMPVKSAEEVIQVGPLVLAKNAKKIKISEAKQVGPKGGLKIRTGKPIEGLQNLKETKTVFNKGGAVPMNSMAKQMDMFDEGGLMDEGGTVDPVSGNDVPPGSTQEEVRDDIPAQLSEGEFVFPADVVRYFGLEKLMEMRQEAKMGLQRMEDMGQMGNSEEAIMPDNLPFSIEDLDMEDEDEYNTPQEFAYGGVVQMPGTNYNTTPNPGPTTGFRPYVAPTIPDYATQPVQQGPQFQGSQLPGTQFIGATQTTNIPTFGQTVGNNPGQYDEFRTYVNSSGQTLQIPFKNGQPLYPIPEGYTLQQDNAIQTTSPKSTVGPTDFESEEGDGPDYGGGTSLITGEKIAGYSPEEIKTGVTSAKDRYAITGNRGFDLLNVLPGGTFIKNLLPDTALNIFGTEPTIPEDSSVPPGIGMPVSALQARNELENSLGVGITGYVGFQKGDLDPNSGGFFDKNGIAVDGKTGDQSKNETGTFNYASFSDFKEALSAGNKSGWRGGKLGAESYSGLSSAAKNKYDKFADILGYTDHKEVEKQTETEKALGYAEGVTQREFDKETASEAAAREAANREQAARQQAARDARDALDRARENDEGGQDTGVGESDGGGYGSDAGTGGGGDMGVICLTEDMKVKCNGVIDFVTNVQVGDIVDYTKVIEVLHKHMREGYYVVNGELKITNDHPVLANGSWKRTENLVLGDYINNVEVTSLEYIEQVTPTVYIGTADDRYDVYTEGEVYTVHGQYKNALKKAA